MSGLELIIGIVGIGCGVFFLYVNIVSHLNIDIPMDDKDDDSYEGELLWCYYYPSFKKLWVQWKL